MIMEEVVPDKKIGEIFGKPLTYKNSLIKSNGMSNTIKTGTMESIEIPKQKMETIEVPKKKKLAPLPYYSDLNMGCDPEFFFTRKGKVIGSEKVLITEKVKADSWSNTLIERTKADSYNGKFIMDGVQAELNPQPSTCRAALGNTIRLCFKDLYDKILKDQVDVSADFSQCIEVDQAEMDSLSARSKIFGCAPSTNVYNEGKTKTSVISVDPKKYLGRSAGGHIHLGTYQYGWNEIGRGHV